MRKRGGIALAVGAILLYGLAMYLFQPSADRQPVGGSSTSANDVGSLALARLWGDMGLSFSTWEQVPALLPRDATADTFVSVEPDDSTYTAKDRAALLQWCRQGHSVVWVSAAHPLHHGADVHTKPLHAHPVHTVLVTDARGTVLSTLSNLSFTTTVELDGPALHTASTLYRTPDGHVLGASFAVGQGRLTDWVVPSVWENGWIGTGDNLRIAWTLTGGHGVWWDEYGHGVVAQSMVGTVFSGGRWYALWLFLAAWLLMIWQGGVRFGRPVPGDEERTRLGTEFAEALAWHLAQPRLRGHASRLMERAVWRRLGQRFGISPDAPAPVFERALSRSAEPVVSERFRTWREAVDEMQPHRRRSRKAFNAATRSLLECLNDDKTQSDHQRGDAH